MTSELPQDLLEKLSELVGIKDILNYISLAKPIGKALEYLKDKLRDYFRTNKYGFTVSDREASAIQKITKTEVYRRMEVCLGSHWSMNLIGLGIYITELNRGDRRILVDTVRSDVHKRYGPKGVKILDIGSTGAIIDIISYLSDVKLKKNYTFLEMQRLFDKILDDWENITIFVKSEHKCEEIKEKCLNYMNNNLPLFFVFAYGSATNPACSAISELNNPEDRKGYLFFSNHRKEGGLDHFHWTFESVERGSSLEYYA